MGDCGGKSGKRTFDSLRASAKIFLHITPRVRRGGEMGLLELAFHPDYTTNRSFFVNSTAINPLRTVVSKFAVSSTGVENSGLPN